MIRLKPSGYILLQPLYFPVVCTGDILSAVITRKVTKTERTLRGIHNNLPSQQRHIPTYAHSAVHFVWRVASEILISSLRKDTENERRDFVLGILRRNNRGQILHKRYLVFRNSVIRFLVQS